MSAARLLDRLERVKQTAPGQWIARCPAHDDSRPSLAIRETESGVVLIRCFAGCDPGAVLGAAGVRFADLFPQRLGEYRPQRRPFDPLQVLFAIEHELFVCDLILCDIEQSRRVTAEHRERLHLAATRISRAIAAAGERPIPDEIRRIRQAVSA